MRRIQIYGSIIRRFRIDFFLSFVSMKTQYIIDETGKKISVILPVKEYEKMIEALEDIHDDRLYDEGVKLKSVGVPMMDAFKQIEAKQKKRS